MSRGRSRVLAVNVHVLAEGRLVVDGLALRVLLVVLVALALVGTVGREGVFELEEQVVVVLDLVHARDEAREDGLKLRDAVGQDGRVEDMRVSAVTGESLAIDRNLRRPIARLLDILLAQVGLAAVLARRAWPEAVALASADACMGCAVCPAVAPDGRHGARRGRAIKRTFVFRRRHAGRQFSSRLGYACTHGLGAWCMGRASTVCMCRRAEATHRCSSGRPWPCGGRSPVRARN